MSGTNRKVAFDENECRVGSSGQDDSFTQAPQARPPVVATPQGEDDWVFEITVKGTDLNVIACLPGDQWVEAFEGVQAEKAALEQGEAQEHRQEQDAYTAAFRGFGGRD